MAAKNPRRGNQTPAAEQAEEAEVSETATDEATEVATTPEAPAAPAAPKVQVDHQENLFTAIMAFASDSDVTALQEAYRAVPTAARGKAQGSAMKRAMGEGGVDMEVLGSVLDAFNDLPTATKSSRTKVELDPITSGAIRLAGAMVAFDELRKDLGDDAFNLADTWYQGDVPEDHAAAVTKVTEGVIKGSALRGGSNGPRSTFKESVLNLIERGVLPAGATLTGANGAEAVVNADGTITSQGKEYKSLSTAAKDHRQKDDGTFTSTNGWDFWQYDGKAVGTLRAE